MSFHHTAPRIDHQGSIIWLTAEAEHLKATIFVTKAQGQQLVEDLIQVVGRRPQPEAAVTPTELADGIFVGEDGPVEEPIHG
jgi:hypothetical protein